MERSDGTTGTTESERRLTQLAKGSFLELWTYPNVYRKAGQEMCDLLVVCGQHILIFSDKDIAWPTGCNVTTAWTRWYREAVEKSVDQLRGAQRWIDRFPDKLFRDAKAHHRFPYDLPPQSTRRVHRIVVANGAAEACRRHIPGGRGSIQISPRIKGTDHNTPSGPRFTAFAIGDVEPDESYVHVMDEVTLKILMKELDTITDFTKYLDQKVRLIREARLNYARGEEELLAWYLLHGGLHTGGFLARDGKWLCPDAVTLVGGEYSALQQNANYQRKQADRLSYVWDRFVNAVTEKMVSGEMPAVEEGQPFAPPTFSQMEHAVRTLALTKRVARKWCAEHFVRAVNASERGKKWTYQPIFLDADHVDFDGTAFSLFFLPTDYLLPETGVWTYALYRQRKLMALTLDTFRQQKHLKRILGIATETPAPVGQPEIKLSFSIFYYEAGAERDETFNEQLSKAVDIATEGFDLGSKQASLPVQRHP